MHYILHLTLEGFFVRHFTSGQSGPIAVLRDGFVLDVNPDARQRGIRVGMEKRTARTIAQETLFFPWEEDRYEEVQRQWLDICTVYTGVIEPDGQGSAYLDLSGHPNPVDVSEKLIRVLVQEEGLQVRFGAASTKWVALLSSQTGDCGVAIRDPILFLSTLPVSKLLPVAPENRERLSFLGYRKIGQIHDIPLKVLREQFGPEGAVIAKAAKGAIYQPVHPRYPRNSLIESLIFEGSVDSLEALDLALKELSERVAKRLSKDNLQGQELEVILELENSEYKRYKRRFSKPIYNKLGSLASFRLLLEGAFTKPVCAIRIQMTNLQPREEKQKTLLSHERAKDQSGFNYIRTVFGEQSVQLGSNILVPRRVRVLREWKNAIGWS